MALRLITPATTPAISLVEAKAHLRVTESDDDTLIEALVKSVTDFVEGPYGFLARALVDQTWQLTLDAFPTNEIQIPLPPLIAVTSIVYDDTDGTPQTFSTGSYTVDAESQPGWVVPDDSGWPDTFDGINAVRITYRAGYVDNSFSPPEGEIPGDIRAALLLHLGSLYENRENVVVGTIVSPLPFGAEVLLRQKRVQLGMA